MLKLLSITLLIFLLGCGVRYDLKELGPQPNKTSEEETESPTKPILAPSEESPIPSAHCNDRDRILLKTKSLNEDNFNEVDITAYSGTQSSIHNYNYYSYSGHPINGPQPKKKVAYFFLYQGDDGLTLNFIINKDHTNIRNAKAQFNVSISGNNMLDEVLFIDDPNAPTDQITRSESHQSSSYIIDLKYSYNSDGFIIGPIQNKKIDLTLSDLNFNKNNKVFFASTDNQNMDLTEKNVVISVIPKCAE